MVLKRPLMPLLLVFFLLAISSCSREPGTAEGTVTFQGGGLEGVAVEVYLQAGKSEGGVPFATAETGPEGRFRLTLPAGEYFLRAKEDAPAFGPRKIGQYPGAVLLRSGEVVTLNPIELSPAGASPETSAPAGAGIRGRILHGREGVEDGAVMIYPEDREVLKGPGFTAQVRSDEEGRFEVDLVPGGYSLVARKRQGGSQAGFLSDGDLSGEFQDNPVEVREGSYTDIGDVELHQVDREKLAAEGGGSSREPSPTRISGVVVGTDGKPLAKQFVFLYRDQGMIGRPDFLTSSGPDGGFVIHLREGGRYFLGARSRFGGPRQPGELVGKVDGAADAAVEIGTGNEVGGLTILMEEVW